MDGGLAVRRLESPVERVQRRSNALYIATRVTDELCSHIPRIIGELSFNLTEERDATDTEYQFIYERNFKEMYRYVIV